MIRLPMRIIIITISSVPKKATAPSTHAPDAHHHHSINHNIINKLLIGIRTLCTISSILRKPRTCGPVRKKKLDHEKETFTCGPYNQKRDTIMKKRQSLSALEKKTRHYKGKETTTCGPLYLFLRSAPMLLISSYRLRAFRSERIS